MLTKVIIRLSYQVKIILLNIDKSDSYDIYLIIKYI